MSSVRTCISTEDRIRNGARWVRIKRGAGLGLLCAAVVAPFAAQSADDLKLPASFRNWYHVNTMVIDKGSPLFEAMGGMLTFISIRPERPRSRRASPIRTRPCSWSICTNSPSPMAPTWKVHGRRPPSC